MAVAKSKRARKNNFFKRRHPNAGLPYAVRLLDPFLLLLLLLVVVVHAVPRRRVASPFSFSILFFFAIFDFPTRRLCNLPATCVPIFPIFPFFLNFLVRLPAGYGLRKKSNVVLVSCVRVMVQWDMTLLPRVPGFRRQVAGWPLTPWRQQSKRSDATHVRSFPGVELRSALLFVVSVSVSRLSRLRYELP